MLLDQSLIQTELDVVFGEEHDREQEPQEALATDGVFFKQGTTDRSNVITQEASGPGEFTAHNREEEIEIANPDSTNKATHSVNNYKRGLKFAREDVMDDQHQFINDQVQGLAMRARTSRDKFSFQNSYAGGFDSVTTSDGANLFSNSHTTVSGDTVDNLETGALSPSNLATLVKRLRVQKGQDGFLAGHNAVGLLVSPTDFPDAMEITKSELKANTTDNNLNYFSTIYPGMVVKTSAYLDSDYEDYANIDTSYYVVSRNHNITRWVREGITTELIDPRFDAQDRWEYRARFREVTSVVSWQGVVASNGTT